MTPAAATAAMRQRSTSIEIERARLSGAMRAIRDMGGMDAVRAITATEFERLSASANDNRDWLG